MADSSKVVANIERNAVELSQTWGATFNDYAIEDGAGKTSKVDFQDLMVSISQYRAVAVEDEVTPLTSRIRQRNADLDELGQALADLTKQQAAFKSDAEGSSQSGTSVSQKTADTIKKFFGYTMTLNEFKQWNEFYLQLVKSKIDALNNAAQGDMTRLQGLVDRRDESYSTATNLMSAISDSRSNLIRNL